ncbi:hypothetical protein [Streptomyces sp. G45]|uniref:hypothetical protein n=1 Tax=Streptomyces sp. G45 TaxID=3406627 RepID=UPI003C247090
MTPAQLLNKQELIKQLQDLAGKPQLGPRAEELDALAHDLERDKRLDRWAELDLVAAYARPESVVVERGRPSARRDALLEAALGALVFVPLLVTWFGLREAVHAYGELSKVDREEATRPFLQLWQSGFGGHLSPLGRFENVALMAVVLIALLVLLSVVHARVRARAEQEEAEQEAERERLLAALASVLTRLQMLLAPHRSASPKQFTSELTKAAGEMRSLAAEAEKNHKALVSATGAVTGATTSLRDAAGKLSAEIPKLGAAADRIDTTLRDGQRAAASAGTANADAARLIADQVKAAGTTVEASLKSLLTAQRELVAKTEAVALATEQASKALVSSTGRTNDAVDGMREATERWDAAAAHWQDAAARVERTVAGSDPRAASPMPSATPMPSAAPVTPGAPVPPAAPVRNGADPFRVVPPAAEADPLQPTVPDSAPYGAPLGGSAPATVPFQPTAPEPTAPGPGGRGTPATEAHRAPGTDASGPPGATAPGTPHLNGGPWRPAEAAPTDAAPVDAPPADAPPTDTPPDAPGDAPGDTPPGSDLRSDRTRALRPPTGRPTPPRPGSDT